MGSNRDQTKYYDQISFCAKRRELEFLEPERDDRVIQFFNSIYREEDFTTYKPVIKRMINKKIKNARKEIEDGANKTRTKKLTRQIESMTKAMATEESLKDYYMEWRTFQASDHLPLWVEIKINFSDDYLDYLKEY